MGNSTQCHMLLWKWCPIQGGSTCAFNSNRLQQPFCFSFASTAANSFQSSGNGPLSPVKGNSSYCFLLPRCCCVFGGENFLQTFLLNCSVLPPSKKNFKQKHLTTKLKLVINLLFRCESLKNKNRRFCTKLTAWGFKLWVSKIWLQESVSKLSMGCGPISNPPKLLYQHLWVKPQTGSARENKILKPHWSPCCCGNHFDHVTYAIKWDPVIHSRQLPDLESQHLHFHNYFIFATCVAFLSWKLGNSLVAGRWTLWSENLWNYVQE